MLGKDASQLWKNISNRLEKQPTTKNERENRRYRKEEEKSKSDLMLTSVHLVPHQNCKQNPNSFLPTKI